MFWSNPDSSRVPVDWFLDWFPLDLFMLLFFVLLCWVARNLFRRFWASEAWDFSPALDLLWCLVLLPLPVFSVWLCSGWFIVMSVWSWSWSTSTKVSTMEQMIRVLVCLCKKWKRLSVHVPPAFPHCTVYLPKSPFLLWIETHTHKYITIGVLGSIILLP